MEMTQAHLVVLTPDGRFLRIPRRSRVCEVGDEIVFTSPQFRWKRPFLTFSSSVAAAIVLCLVAFNGITPNLGGLQPVVAYVTLDINPSIEIGIDVHEDVQELRGLNEDGTQLIQQLDFKGKSISTVTSELLERVEAKGLFAQDEGDIIISSTKAYEAAKIDDVAVSELVKESVDKHIQENHPQAQGGISVASLVAPIEMRNAALSEGVSPGKYAIYLNAKSNGSSVTIEEIKTQSIHKIAQERGGIDKLIDTKQLPKKETLSKLLEEEKKGELDTKVKQSQGQNGQNGKDSKNDKNSKDDKDDKKNDDKKSSGKTDAKPTPTPTKKPDGGKASVKPTPTPTPKKTNTPTSYVPPNRNNQEEERRKQEELKKNEERRQQEEQQRKAEEEKKRQEELKKKQEEEKRKQEEEKKRQENDNKKDDRKQDPRSDDRSRDESRDRN